MLPVYYVKALTALFVGIDDYRVEKAQFLHREKEALYQQVRKVPLKGGSLYLPYGDKGEFNRNPLNGFVVFRQDLHRVLILVFPLFMAFNAIV